MQVSAALVLGCLLASHAVFAEDSPSSALLILSKSDRTLAIVDPSSLKVVARAPVGPDPHEVVASSDGRFAYVSNYGFGAYNTLAVIDLVAQKALPSVDLGVLRGPHGLMFKGGKVWFTAEAAKAIGSYDPAEKKIDWVLGTGQNRTHMIFVSDDLKRIVTANVSSGSMSIIEQVVRTGPGPRGPGPGVPGPGGPPQTDWDQTVIPVGRGPEGFDVSPDGKEIWVANSTDGTVSIFDPAQKRVMQTLNAEVRGANRLKFTPDGRLVFISTLGGPDVTILDAATRQVVKRVKVGRGAAGIQMDPDGSRVFVACTPDDYVAIIDLKSQEVTGHIDAGKQPDGMAWAVRR
jgi:YVTN family beta-propeller protein